MFSVSQSRSWAVFASMATLLLFARVGEAQDTPEKDGPRGNAEPVHHASLPLLYDVARTTGVPEAVRAPARLRVQDATLGAALVELHRSSGVRLLFSPSLIPGDRTVHCDCLEASVGEALQHLLSDTGLKFIAHGNQVVIAPVSGGEFTTSSNGNGNGSSLDEALRAPSDRQIGLSPAQRWAPRPLPAQTGTIAGRVLDRASSAPLSSVQISVPALGIGVVTDGDGTFQINEVPVGSHEVTARMIGYRPGTTEVTVSAGETTTVEFLLVEQVLALDEVLVTGTAGQARRREVGNTIVQVDLSERTDVTPNLDQLLQARGPGISVVESGPSPGAGARIRLRGVTSLTQGNQPPLYIDGVRMHNNSPPANTPIDGSRARSSHVHVTPMNDINPEDIERIEIIKGASATTLYGAEAASGVIQIFTKQGASGSPVYSVQLDYGFDRLAEFAPEPEPFMRLECCLRTGERRRVTTTVGGGTDFVRYFMSATVEDNTGVLPVDRQEKINLRGNFTMQLTEDLSLEYNTGWTRNDMRHTPQGNNSQGLVTIAFRDRSSSLGENWRDLIDEETRKWEITNDQTHLMTGLTARYTLTPRISTRFTLGLDQVSSDNRNVRPFGFLVQPTGVVNTGQWSHETSTVDWVTNADFSPMSDLSTTLSVGAQLVSTDESFVNAYSDNLPGPGVPTVSSGARQLSSEERQRVIRGGAFVQTLFGYRDRYFLTAGLRVDGNSAFGENLGLEPYPKASFSWVIGEEEFWPERLGEQVRLRAAYGHAGRAPGAFDAARTWQPVGFGGDPAFFPGNVGNPDLGPERTAELELGFDASFFEDRLSIEFTYFNQQVTDLLFALGQIPTLGFGGSQLTNVGKVENKGIELALSGTVLETGWGGWDVGVNVSTQNNKVLDMGDAPETSSIREGFPFPLVSHIKLFNPDEIAEPDFVTDHIFGPRWPTETVSVRTSLRLPRGIVLSGRGEYMGGFYITSGGIFNTAGRLAWPECEVRGYEYLAAGRGDELTAYERLVCDPTRPGGAIPQTYPADFFKVRELSVRFPLPVQRLGNASVTLAARNVFRWTNKEWRWNDPEIMSRSGDGSGLETLAGGISEDLPGPRMFTISVRTTF